MNEYCDTSTIITDGIQRSRLLFGKHSLTHSYYKNIKAISEADATEGALYHKWLMQTKIPELKHTIENALINTLKPTEDMELLEKYIDEFNLKLDKFRELCKKEYDELSYLRSYA